LKLFYLLLVFVPVGLASKYLGGPALLTFATAASGLLCAVVLAGSLLMGGAGGFGAASLATEPPREVAMEQPVEQTAEEEAVVMEVLPTATVEPVDEEGTEGAAEGFVETAAPERQPPAPWVATPTASAAVVVAGKPITGTAAPPERPGLNGSPPPTPTVPPPPTPTPEETVAASPVPIPSTQAPLPPLEIPGARRPLSWTLWPLVGGLTLLTLGLAVAAGLAWRARRR